MSPQIPITDSGRKLNETALSYIVIALAFVGLTWALFAFLPLRSDWHIIFRPATLAFIQGRSPYAVEAFYNSPWTLIPLIPMALLPAQLSRAVLFMVSFIAYAFVAVRLGAKPIGMIAFLLSYPVVYGLIYGQIDGLVALGFVLPPQIGLLFVFMKPQVGIGVAIFWLVEAWRSGGGKS